MKYTVIGFLTSWIFPTKKDQKAFRIFCRELDARKKSKTVQKNYQKVLKKLQTEIKNRKLNVVFLCGNNTQWTYQSLYEELANSPHFNVKIIIALKEKQINPKEFLIENYNFFKDRGMNVELAMDSEGKKYLSSDTFKPDIIFYDTPWSIPNEYKLSKISKEALCCYTSYGSCITNGSNEFGASFYKEIWTYFLDNKYMVNTLIEHGSDPENLAVSGHLKLDAYLSTEPAKNHWKTDNKLKIIYAPHHSFYKNSVLGFGTFLWNYKFFLEFAKSHPEIDIILKPHPHIKEQIVQQKLMTEKEMRAYFEEWNSLPNVLSYEQGDYFDIFKTSDCLITDCNSFLYEYLPTLKPVIHLISENSVGHNEFGEKIVEGYYKAHNVEEIERFIEQVVINGDDPLKKTREELSAQLVNPNGNAKFVADYLLEKLEGISK